MINRVFIFVAFLSLLSGVFAQKDTARDYRYGNSNDTNFIYSWSSVDSGPVVEFTLKEDKPLELLVFGGCDTEIFNSKLVTLSSINYFFRKVIFRRRMVKFDWE